LCIPKEVADKRAENDFWKFCNRNLEGFYGSCRTEWQDEIFINCIDAEVVGDGSAPNPSPTLAPLPTTSPMPSRGPTASPDPTLVPSPSPASCVPIGDCGAYPWCNQESYESWCADQVASCPAPYCKVTTFPSSTPNPAPVPMPTPMPMPTPVPVPTLMPTSTPSGTCVASLESFYTDASIWEPYCASLNGLGVVGNCPAPMCKISASMLATSRRHNFLGTSLIQAGTGIAHDVFITEGKIVQEEL